MRDYEGLPSVSTEDLYRFLVESLTEYAIFAISEVGTIVSWNTGAEHLFGFNKVEALGQSFDIIFSAEDRMAAAPATEMREALETGRSASDRWHVRADGSRFWATNIVQPMCDASGKFRGFTKIVRDATERYTAAEAARESHERYQMLVETVREFALFAISLDGLVSVWNAGAEALFGYSAAEIVGRPSSTLLTPEDVRRDVAHRELEGAGADGFYHDERWLVRKDGSRFFASSRITRIRSDAKAGSQTGFVKIAYDITDRKSSEEAMRELALHDSLTGLPNRTFFIDRLRYEISRTSRDAPDRFAVLFLDVDDFKLVNDSLGHSIADRLLQALASRLRGIKRETDVIARLGGDEFAILLADVRNRAEVDAFVRRIESALELPLQIETSEVFISASIGIAIHTSHYTKPEEALRDADIAMYAAKAIGRGKHAFFVSAMREPIVARQQMDAQMRRGLEREEFVVAYQSIVDLRDAAIVGFEALVRWQHPSRHTLLPGSFLHVARQNDLDVALDRFVLRTALRDVARSNGRRGADAFLLTVNMTARQFETSDFVAFVEAVLHETGFPASRLKIEITETTLMEKYDGVRTTIDALCDLGVQLYIDDFGTGYSSLSYLADLRVEALKIDRSFVAKLGTLPKHDSITSTIVELAHGLQLRAIAEGIETTEQLQTLRAMGCDYGQGFLFSHPTDWATASRRLESETVRAATALG